MDISQIRYARFRTLVDDERQKNGAGEIGRIAKLLGKSQGQVSLFGGALAKGETRRPKAIGNKVAREIEAAFDLPSGWLDSMDHPPAQAVEVHGANEIDHVRWIQAYREVDEQLKAQGREVDDVKRGELVKAMYAYILLREAN